jgi:hypothetical protein
MQRTYSSSAIDVEQYLKRLREVFQTEKELFTKEGDDMAEGLRDGERTHHAADRLFQSCFIQ